MYHKINQENISQFTSVKLNLTRKCWKTSGHCN